MEKAPGSSGSKPTKKLGKGYGDIFKEKNKGPFDPIDPDKLKGIERPAKPSKTKDVKAAGADKIATPEDLTRVAPLAAEIAPKVGAKHEEMLRTAEQETNQQREQERLTNIAETVDILKEKAAEAGQRGDKVLSKKIEETLQDLEKDLERAGTVRRVREIAKQYTDKDLGNAAASALAEHARREAELDGGAQSVAGETGLGMSGERLEAIMEGLRDEAAERVEKQKNVAQQELTAQVDEDLKTAAGIETNPDASTDAKVRRLKELLPILRNKTESAAISEELKKKLHEDLVTKEGARAGKEPFPTVLQEIKDKNAPKVRVVKDAGTTKTRIEEERAKDKGEWREYFGPLAEIQEEAERGEQKSKEDRAAWREYFGPLAEIQEEIERGGVAQRPEKGTTQEISGEKLVDDFKKAVQGRAETIEQKTPEEHKGFMRRMGERYRAMPRWKKFLISGALLGGAVGSSIVGGPAATLAWGFWLAQRGMAGLGGFALVDAATERMKNRYAARLISGGAGIAAIFLPSAVQHLDHNYFHVGDWIREHWFGSGGGKGNPLFNPNPTPGAPGWIEHAATAGAGIEHLFDQPVIVTPDDSTEGLWGILKDRLEDANIIDENTPKGRVDRMLVFLEDKFRDLGPDGITKLGFRSENLDNIYPGDKLDISFLVKEGWIDQAKLLR